MKLKLCEVMQDEDKLHIDAIKFVLSRDCVKDYAYILHDKDKDDNGDYIRPHWHIAIRFKDSNDTKYIAQWFGIEEQYVGKVKGRWSDMLA